eukprot:SAG11_NODE_2472_length_3319_cov_2.525155_4_plen_82_part_00
MRPSFNNMQARLARELSSTSGGPGHASTSVGPAALQHRGVADYNNQQIIRGRHNCNDHTNYKSTTAVVPTAGTYSCSCRSS